MLLIYLSTSYLSIFYKFIFFFNLKSYFSGSESKLESGSDIIDESARFTSPVPGGEWLMRTNNVMILPTPTMKWFAMNGGRLSKFVVFVCRVKHGSILTDGEGA